MKRHCLVLLASERWEYPEDAYFRLDFASRHISSSLCVTRPFTNGVEWGWKKCTDPMVGGARSITLYDACTPSSDIYIYTRTPTRLHYPARLRARVNMKGICCQ